MGKIRWGILVAGLYIMSFTSHVFAEVGDMDPGYDAGEAAYEANLSAGQQADAQARENESIFSGTGGNENGGNVGSSGGPQTKIENGKVMKLQEKFVCGDCDPTMAWVIDYAATQQYQAQKKAEEVAAAAAKAAAESAAAVADAAKAAEAAETLAQEGIGGDSPGLEALGKATSAKEAAATLNEVLDSIEYSAGSYGMSDPYQEAANSLNAAGVTLDGRSTREPGSEIMPGGQTKVSVGTITVNKITIPLSSLPAETRAKLEAAQQKAKELNTIEKWEKNHSSVADNTMLGLAVNYPEYFSAEDLKDMSSVEEKTGINHSDLLTVVNDLKSRKPATVTESAPAEPESSKLYGLVEKTSRKLARQVTQKLTGLVNIIGNAAKKAKGGASAPIVGNINGGALNGLINEAFAYRSFNTGANGLVYDKFEGKWVEPNHPVQ